ncbi:MAG: hypothetical protein OXU67_01410, partial [Chloroflexota bacterium]|nr:hypothetical protein [Chloroflexota bacterium]
PPPLRPRRRLRAPVSVARLRIPPLRSQTSVSPYGCVLGRRALRDYCASLYRRQSSAASDRPRRNAAVSGLHTLAGHVTLAWKLRTMATLAGTGEEAAR